MSVGWRQYTERAGSRIAAAIGMLKLVAAPPKETKELVMAKVIEFYTPKNFRKPLKWTPQLQRGKVIEFCMRTEKSA